MTTEQHLKKIVAKCRELLAIAEKRTAGKWHYERSANNLADVNEQLRADVEFSCACAGAAEAGWRATIVAIEALREIEENGFAHCDRVIAIILAAWPEELL